MKMRENMQAIKKHLANDETLLRLLYYKPSNYNDNPLDPLKPNIGSMDEDEKWEIIEDVIKSTEKTTDLDVNTKCRILFYAGTRSSTNNYLFAEQEVIFDVLVHIDAFDEKDMRLSWICDHLNQIIGDKQITGIGKAYFDIGRSIAAPVGYVGYRLIYNFGSGKL